MRALAFAFLLLALFCGCQSAEAPRTATWLLNRMFATHCPVRRVEPGAKWIDYDHGGGWVELGTDGKTHPIPDPVTPGD